MTAFFSLMKKIFLLLVIHLLVTACEPGKHYNKISGPTMGTQFNIIYQSDGINSEALKDNIVDQLELINQLMSTYIPDSEINRFNNDQSDNCFVFSSQTWDVLLAAKDIYHQTHGAFDITVGPLVSRWGFSAEEYHERVPSPLEVAELLAIVGTDKLQYNHQQQCITKQVKAVQINLSAIAKGYAVDRIANILDDFSINNYLVDIGGESKAKGLNPTGQTWTIAIEKPVSLARQQAVILSLDNNSIATSGDYRNYFEYQGQRFSHTIDPTTGYPITHKLTSISVIHPSNMYADGYATALSVLGEEQALNFAAEMKLPVFIIERDKENIKSYPNVYFENFLKSQQ